MAVQGSTSAIVGDRSTDGKITNLTLASAGTEYSHPLQNGLKALEFKSREAAIVRFSFVAGETATRYMSVPKNTTYSNDGMNLEGKTLYLQADTAGTIVEIIEWT